METWVSNASPLILLGHLGLLDLLHQLPQRLVVPAPVAAEILLPPAVDWLRGIGSSCILPVEGHASVIPWDLGKGETAVLSWGMHHPGCILLLDDLAARKCASRFHMRVRGTFGILVHAKRTGKIAAVKPLFERLAAVGLHASPTVLRAALEAAGEV